MDQVEIGPRNFDELCNFLEGELRVFEESLDTDGGFLKSIEELGEEIRLNAGWKCHRKYSRLFKNILTKREKWFLIPEDKKTVGCDCKL